MLLLQFLLTRTDPNSKTKIQNIKIEFRKVNSEWKSEGIGYEKLLNMNDFFKIFENLETSSE